MTFTGAGVVDVYIVDEAVYTAKAGGVICTGQTGGAFYYVDAGGAVVVYVGANNDVSEGCFVAKGAFVAVDAAGGFSVVATGAAIATGTAVAFVSVSVLANWDG